MIVGSYFVFLVSNNTVYFVNSHRPPTSSLLTLETDRVITVKIIPCMIVVQMCLLERLGGLFNLHC